VELGGKALAFVAPFRLRSPVFAASANLATGFDFLRVGQLRTADNPLAKLACGLW